MAKISRNFTAGRMNKTFDERIVPQGEYIDALNIRMGSTEQSEVGVIENSKGNTVLTALKFQGVPLSNQARTIGSIVDGARETIYWFVHDPNFPVSFTAPLGKIDMIVSFNENLNVLTYHIVSVNNPSIFNTTTLNFNPQYLITGINIVDDFIYFTDDYNQPRFFNIKKNYPSPLFSGFDDPLLAESILVIKRPPAESPEVVLTTINGAENYLEDRFICFAYRYEYDDNQYSAISQFSAPAFFPKPFDLTDDAFLNEGMVNQFNAAEVTVNTGGPLVKSIDLLFKDMNSNVIKVIEKVNKNDRGLTDNANFQYLFSNSKIFTILPEAELLRLYDNVPLLAKAQTIMGNRLMYGNYVEGYDLIDKNGANVMLGYFLNGISERKGVSSLNDATSFISGNYNINGAQTIADSVIQINFSSVTDPILGLVQGALINIDFTFTHAAFSGSANPVAKTSDITLSFYYQLPFNYANIADVVSSIEFQDAIGTALNILPVYDPGNPAITPCDGFTFTDNFNCNIPAQLDTYEKYSSGINVPGQPLAVTAAGSVMTIQLVAMRFVDDLISPLQNVYEYYKFVSADVTYSQSGDSKSLHSNRDYEIGIVYMDEFNRATTALVSPDNTVHFPCSTSEFKNSIQVTIPVTQRAPAWAKRYKFVIKPDKAGYETIYSNIYFQDPNTNSVYLLLQGENERKVEVGDRYIVKADATGPKDSCSYATVLEKEAKLSGFLGFAQGPTGIYMKMNANDFIVSNESNSKIAPGVEQDIKKSSANQNNIEATEVIYPMNLPELDPITPELFIDYTVPEGSVFSITINADRRGAGSSCEKIGWVVNLQVTASADYPNMYEFFRDQNIFSLIKAQADASAVGGQVINYSDTLYVFPYISDPLLNNFLFFKRDTVTNELSLVIKGVSPCTGIQQKEDRKAVLTVNASLFRATVNLIFETLPVDALPDVFYENELSFEVGPNGEHFGNVQNQDFGGFLIVAQPGIVDTGFFNCYTFGNGAESYKIRDSIIGRTLELGNRVTSVAAQDYQQVDRFSDITYSGIYNNESNVNRLNEFNLGILNFKNCEQSFGPIYILDGRQTDVLTLQEDKISYVLAGKNLLSDAAAGGAVTSVPEVLGTQIARSENYGISFNPESYVQWGYDRYFTDAKRGAVIQIKGDSYSNDQLKVISESGMRTWFRDLFNDSFQTQKLGAFDPYMNEYVLSSNNIEIPQPVECIECGINRTFTFDGPGVQSFCVNQGLAVGLSYFEYFPSDAVEFQIVAIYDVNVYDTGIITTAGFIDIPKYLNNVQEMQFFVYAYGALSLDITVACVDPNPLTVIEVVVTNNYESGKTLHPQYRYSNGTYNSPTQSSFVVFGSDLSSFVISRYNSNTGLIGQGAFPTPGSTLRIISNQFPSDTFAFDPASNRLRYLTTNTLYNNNISDITTLLSLASNAPITTVSPTYHEGILTVPALDDYLYLIWDLRDSVESSLCFGTTVQDVCCNCDNCADSNCKSYIISNAQAPFASVQYIECGDISPTTISVQPNRSVVICANKSYLPIITSGVANITIYNNCGCE
jgi:hypothetical protein